jgi:hypothetical protein
MPQVPLDSLQVDLISALPGTSPSLLVNVNQHFRRCTLPVVIRYVLL